MSENMVERVALAMVNADQRRLDLPELGSIEEFRFASDRSFYEMLARAAIEEMREPTADMLSASWAATQNVDPETRMASQLFMSTASLHKVKTRYRWQAMIDAALLTTNKEPVGEDA